MAFLATASAIRTTSVKAPRLEKTGTSSQDALPDPALLGVARCWAAPRLGTRTLSTRPTDVCDCRCRIRQPHLALRCPGRRWSSRRLRAPPSSHVAATLQTDLTDRSQYALSSNVSPKEAKKLEDKAKASLGLQVPPPVASSEDKQAQKSADAYALNAKEFRTFKLIKKEDYNHNTALFTFELPEGKESGLTVASALLTRSGETEGDAALLDDKGKPVIRPYTVRPAPSP